MSKITFPLHVAIAKTEDRLPAGIKADAKEYALHQVNFDRDNHFSEIQKVVRMSGLFTKSETKNPAFQQGIEAAETEAKKENHRLRGTVLWNL